jgi:ubiquinone/menaquinone biosynthesis C-methylase UbiE
MKKPHVFDPRHVAILEMEERRLWENPDKVLSAVEVKPNFVAADLGCGSGFFTMPLSKKVKKVYAIDVQKEMLNFLEQKIQGLHIKNIEPLLSKENKVPLEGESVDLLVSVNTLHEFSDKERMVEEIRRVLKQNGKALIADFKKENTAFGPPVTIRVSEKQAIKLFEKKCFTTSKTQNFLYHYLLVFSK